LRAARSFDDPDDRDFRRVRTSVLTQLVMGVGATVGVTVGASHAGAATALFGGVLVKWSAAVIVLGGLACTYVAVRSHDGSRFHATVATDATPVPASAWSELPSIASEEPSPIETIPAAPPPSAPAMTVGRARAASSAPVRRHRIAVDLEGEAQLLEEADAELRAGAPQAALARLAEHATKYPTGALSEERDGVRVIALCGAGQRAEARVEADRLLSASRKTSLATRIREACSFEPSAN